MHQRVHSWKLVFHFELLAIFLADWSIGIIRRRRRRGDLLRNTAGGVLCQTSA